MSDSPAKKDLSREQFVVECRADIERLRAAGADPEIIEVYEGLLIIHGYGNDPGLYADLYEGYSEQGLMSNRAAALGALYAFIATFSRHPLEPVRKVYQRAKRRSMILIIARVTKASAVRTRCSKSLARRRLRLSQESVRSTTQRFGRTSKPFVSGLRRTISSRQRPVLATAATAFGP